MTLGVLGGTFDPIHLGHLAAGDAAQQALSFDSMLLIPSRIPPHRADPVTAGPEDRFAMAKLAAKERPGWTASRIELDREGRVVHLRHVGRVARRHERGSRLGRERESKGRFFS